MCVRPVCKFVRPSLFPPPQLQMRGKRIKEWLNESSGAKPQAEPSDSEVLA